MNPKDCSQGFCTFYCPQWCNIIFPPPPPPIQFPLDDSSPNFSPLSISIIAFLACIFLLVSYYTILSKYCWKNDSNSTRRRENHGSSGEVLDDDHNLSTHEPWQVSTTGLDEALIESIAVCKYQKGEGLVDVTDCSVCLGEFREDESLRLLPKCNHAFHVHCIDAWLRSHSNCPLCRANIVFVSASPIPSPPPVTPETPPGNEAGANDAVIEIREEGHHHQLPRRRSVSMDYLCEPRVSVADVLLMDQEEDCHFSSGIAGSSKQCTEDSKPSNKMRVLQCAMKRSFSSGRFFLSRQAIPL